MKCLSNAEMSEWFKEHDWKSCVRLKRTGGSNPLLCASIFKECSDLATLFFFAFSGQKIARTPISYPHFLCKNSFFRTFGLQFAAVRAQLPILSAFPAAVPQQPHWKRFSFQNQAFFGNAMQAFPPKHARVCVRARILFIHISISYNCI